MFLSSVIVSFNSDSIFITKEKTTEREKRWAGGKDSLEMTNNSTYNIT